MCPAIKTGLFRNPHNSSQSPAGQLPIKYAGLDGKVPAEYKQRCVLWWCTHGNYSCTICLSVRHKSFPNSQSHPQICENMEWCPHKPNTSRLSEKREDSFCRLTLFSDLRLFTSLTGSIPKITSVSYANLLFFMSGSYVSRALTYVRQTASACKNCPERESVGSLCVNPVPFSLSLFCGFPAQFKSVKFVGISSVTGLKVEWNDLIGLPYSPIGLPV